MNDIKAQKDKIVEQLKNINAQITDEVIENATKEEMEQYIELIDSITTKLKLIDLLENNN